MWGLPPATCGHSTTRFTLVQPAPFDSSSGLPATGGNPSEATAGPALASRGPIQTGAPGAIEAPATGGAQATISFEDIATIWKNEE